jgi:hypothetical protein
MSGLHRSNLPMRPITDIPQGVPVSREAKGWVASIVPMLSGHSFGAYILDVNELSAKEADGEVHRRSGNALCSGLCKSGYPTLDIFRNASPCVSRAFLLKVFSVSQNLPGRKRAVFCMAKHGLFTLSLLNATEQSVPSALAYVQGSSIGRTDAKQSFHQQTCDHRHLTRLWLFSLRRRQ